MTAITHATNKQNNSTTATLCEPCTVRKTAAVIQTAVQTTIECTLSPNTVEVTSNLQQHTKTAERCEETTKAEIPEPKETELIESFSAEPESEGQQLDETTTLKPKDNGGAYSNNAYSEHEIDLIARTIYLESGSCSEYCQWLTGSTILNLADDRNGVESVVFDYNTFNVAGCLYSTTPSDLSYSVARRVASGDRDYNVKAFRAGYYHSFGTPYTNVDNVYFSTY